MSQTAKTQISLPPSLLSENKNGDNLIYLLPGNKYHTACTNSRDSDQPGQMRNQLRSRLGPFFITTQTLT